MGEKIESQAEEPPEASDQPCEKNSELREEHAQGPATKYEGGIIGQGIFPRDTFLEEADY